MASRAPGRPSPGQAIIGFWKPQHEHGVFSQWFASPFTDEAGVEYANAEGYMMYQKALLFGDTATGRRMLATTNPNQLRTLGRQVKPYDETTWGENRYQIVYQGNVYKFTQNDNLLKQLLATGDAYLVELSPSDRIWGVGTADINPAKWKGTNLLGRILMDVRAALAKTSEKDIPSGRFPQGLTLNNRFLTIELEQALLEEIDAQPWSEALARRTQHYGFEYNYKAKQALTEAPPMPPLIQWVADNLAAQGVFGDGEPDQCIVNEYTQKQGITPHTDSAAAFGEVVVSITLGDPALMEFTRGSDRVAVWLKPRSIVILTGESRYEWKHGLSDKVNLVRPNGTTYKKPKEYRRVSLTYRTMK